MTTMINQAIITFRHERFKKSLFLLVLTIFCFSISIIRAVYSDSNLFLFLNWNLFLAFIPWALTSVLMLTSKLQRSKIIVGLTMVTWLLFFPNAPYILTDLFHLKQRSFTPIWFDLVLILSFAWTGLLFGFMSLWDIEKILSKSMKSIYVNMISVILLFVGSFGIYLGRYLRWNSWDILNEPVGLFYEIGHRLGNPLTYPRAWGMTLFMGIFLNIVYWSFRMIKSRS